VRRAYDTAWQRKLYDAGYAGLAWPKQFGGRGFPATQQLVYLEEYMRAGAPYISTNFVGMMHAGPTLIAEGTDEQRSFHLPRILKGDDIWCQGFSEPGAGSDLASLRTRAVLDGDEYVVTGQKIWSTRAHVADYCELLVRTDTEAKKHQGITWLILDMHQPGVEARPIRTIDGESHFCELFLNEARVPVTNRVGAENDVSGSPTLPSDSSGEQRSLSTSSPCAAKSIGSSRWRATESQPKAQRGTIPDRAERSVVWMGQCRSALAYDADEHRRGLRFPRKSRHGFMRLG
jgi:hypothetical protein